MSKTNNNNNNNKERISYLSLIKMFPDNDTARRFIEKIRWNGHVVCPVCGSIHVTGRRGKREGNFWCNNCKKEFSVRTGTIMECTRLPLHKWIYAMFLFVTCRNGISATELAENIEITQKSAWYLLQRIRLAAGNGDKLLKGIIEADETYIGGKEKFKHKSKKSHAGRGPVGKIPVFGMISRENGHVVAKVVEDTKSTTLAKIFNSFVSANSLIYTDECSSYDKLNEFGYIHKNVNHSAGKYVIGDVHTNKIENFWNNLKTRIKGTYRAVTLKHLQKYVDETAYAYNEGNIKNPVMNRIISIIFKMFGIFTRYKIMTRRLTEFDKRWYKKELESPNLVR